MKVLLADDHRLMLDGIRRALEEDGGFEIVGETQNGAQVLPLVGQTGPDLVVLDVRMPNMDGVEFRKHQIALAGAASIPVVVTSADGNLREVIAEMKAQAYLPKPVGRSELVSTVSRFCDDDEQP